MTLEKQQSPTRGQAQRCESQRPAPRGQGSRAIQLPYPNTYETIWEYRESFLSGRIDFPSVIGPACPICGHKGCYREITPYWRYAMELFPAFAKKRIPIARFLCRRQPRTFSLLPLQLIPYCRYTANAILGSLLLALECRGRGQRGFRRPRRLDASMLRLIEVKCKAYPQFSAQRLYEELRDQQLLGDPPVHYNTLLRVVKSQGWLSLRKRTDARKAYEVDNFNELWICDFMHGPQVLSHNRSLKAILCAIIDDHSRMVVGHAFSASETISALTLQDDYHHKLHTGIGERPIDRCNASLSRIDVRRLSKAELDEIFLIRHERVVNNDATISFKQEFPR